MRQRPMDAIIKGLIEENEITQQIMVISGLGGCGKTQLALKFARDFQERCEQSYLIAPISHYFQVPAYPLRRR
jgi:predicted AAA+ superfamily ATPase